MLLLWNQKRYIRNISQKYEKNQLGVNINNNYIRSNLLNSSLFQKLITPFNIKMNDNIGVALSGGVDSMALMLTVNQWFKKRNKLQKKHHNNNHHLILPKLYAIHVDHGLRKESVDEAKLVSEWMRHWNIEMLQKRIKTTPTSARDDRYQALIELCEQNNIEILFMAHHLNDVIETFLMRLMRYSGLHGLGSIQPELVLTPKLRLIRPLLNVERKVLHATCLNLHQAWIHDPSNENLNHDRVRIRQATYGLFKPDNTLNLEELVEQEAKLLSGALDLSSNNNDNNDMNTKYQKETLNLLASKHTKIPFFNIVNTIHHMQENRKLFEMYIEKCLQIMTIYVKSFNICHLIISKLLKQPKCLQPIILGHVIKKVSHANYLHSIVPLDNTLKRIKLLKQQRIQIGDCLLSYTNDNMATITKRVVENKFMELNSPKYILWQQRHNIRFEPQLDTPSKNWNGPKILNKMIKLYEKAGYQHSSTKKHIKLVHKKNFCHIMRPINTRDRLRIFKQFNIKSNSKNSKNSTSKTSFIELFKDKSYIEEIKNLPNYIFNSNLPIIIELNDEDNSASNMLSYENPNDGLLTFIPHLPGLHLSKLQKHVLCYMSNT